MHNDYQRWLHSVSLLGLNSLKVLAKVIYLKYGILINCYIFLYTIHYSWGEIISESKFQIAWTSETPAAAVCRVWERAVGWTVWRTATGTPKAEVNTAPIMTVLSYYQ